MQIASIEVIRVAVPYGIDGPASAPLPSTGGRDTRAGRAMETLQVRVTADDGKVGWGEAFGHRINPATFAALVECVGPMFIGAPIDVSSAPVASSRIELALKAFHLAGRTGPAHYAISALDTALWDLKAQARGEPLYRTLGGGRDTLRVYASLVTYDGVAADVVRNVMRAYDAGFRHIKLHEKEFAAIKAVREALPADAELMVDVNCVWPPDEARRQATLLQPLGLAWLEEPVWPPDDFESLASLRDLGVPLAAGENASGIDGLERYLKAGAPDVIQPSVPKIGGITSMIDAFRIGQRYGVRVQPHCFYYGCGLLATAHAIAGLDGARAAAGAGAVSGAAGAAGNAAMLEVPWIDFVEQLSPETTFRSEFKLSDRPGLGYQPDLQVMERYTLARAMVG